jgi:hypothetical protein
MPYISWTLVAWLGTTLGLVVLRYVRALVQVKALTITVSRLEKERAEFAVALLLERAAVVAPIAKLLDDKTKGLIRLAASNPGHEGVSAAVIACRRLKRELEK